MLKPWWKIWPVFGQKKIQPILDPPLYMLKYYVLWRIDKCLYGLYCTIQSFNCLGFKRIPLY